MKNIQIINKKRNGEYLKNYRPKFKNYYCVSNQIKLLP